MTVFLGIVGAVLVLVATLILGWFLGVVHDSRLFVHEQLAAANRLSEVARNPVELRVDDDVETLTLTDNATRQYYVFRLVDVMHSAGRSELRSEKLLVLKSRGAFS